MNPKDLFQTSLRIAGVLILVYTIPRAVSDLLSLFGPAYAGRSAAFEVITVLRILWEILVPLWLVGGAKWLTRTIYGSA
ncbi:MAG TPA: hypothetical protein VFE31_12415 [Opitutaceae bacterium]|jgi:hypothetical protein|nr:hypothetical protein [Opitutaceae bacterium]